MPSPPKDAAGLVKPHDDHDTIPDSTNIIRYIIEDWLIPIEGSDQRRLTKGAFSGSNVRVDPYQGMSVDMQKALIEASVNPIDRMTANFAGAVVLEAGRLRQLGLLVGPDPMDVGDPYHANVWGIKSTHQKKILRIATWLLRPPDVLDLP